MKISKKIGKKLRLKLAVAATVGIIGFASSFNSVFAADARNIDLDETIQLALENNRTIKQAIVSRESAYWSLKTAGRRRGPNISVTSQALGVGGSYYEQYNHHRLFSNSASFSMPIYDGNALKEGQVAARYGLNAADLTLENTLQAVKLQATTYYYRVLQTKNYIEVGEENVRTLQEHLNNVNAQFRAGTVAKADVLSSEVNLANAQQALVTYSNNYDIAVATLSNYLLLPADTILRTQDELTYTKYNLNLENCTAYALENRPDVAAADYAVKQAESSIRSAKAGRSPTLNAVASAGINGDKPFNKEYSDSWTAGISASWNVFDNGLVDAQVHSAETALLNAQETAATTREQVQLEVQSAYLTLQAAEKNIMTTKTAIVSAEEDFLRHRDIKTIVNPRRVRCFTNPHYAKYFTGCGCIDERKFSVPQGQNPKGTVNRIQINHYYLKSREEFFKKRQRGRADFPKDYSIEQFEAQDRNVIEDTGARDLFPQLKQISEIKFNRSRNDGNQRAMQNLNLMLASALQNNSADENFDGQTEKFLACF